MVKKSRNPLKMFGSWIGFALGIFIYLNESIVDGKYCPKFNHVADTMGRIFCAENISAGTTIGIPTMLFYPMLIVGLFLVGWGINSLIRKYA